MEMVREIYQVVEKRLKDKALRFTSQRRIILEILLAAKDQHLTVEEVYLKAKEMSSDIGIATAYRTLELFTEIGIVHKSDFGDGAARYEVVSPKEKHYHHHLICLKCGQIIEFNDDLLEDLEEEIGRKSNFKIKDHDLRFYGYCESCQDEMRKE